MTLDVKSYPNLYKQTYRLKTKLIEQLLLQETYSEDNNDIMNNNYPMEYYLIIFYKNVYLTVMICHLLSCIIII